MPAQVSGRTWADRPRARRTAALLATAAVAAAGLTAGAAAPASAAVTAATSCNATQAQIYQPPAGAITLAPGTVLRCRKTAASTTAVRPVDAYQIQYVTTDVKGRRVATSGVVLVPLTLLGPGSLKIVGYSSTTVGLGTQCAGSKQFTYGFQDDFEVSVVSDYLNDGYAIAFSDGIGYLDGQTHSYVVGVNNGNAQLDAVRAATRVPGLGLRRSAPVALTGYSEGGHSTLWAAQRARSYAPELPIVGAAAGAAPSDLRAVAANLNGQFYAGFLADAVVGLSSAYPEQPFRELLNPAGTAAVADVSKQCLAGTLASWAFKKLEDYSTDHLTLEQIYALRGTTGRTWGQVIDDQKVGVGVGRPGSGARYEIGFPMLAFWGAQDDVIPPASIDAGVKRYCAAGVKVARKTYLGVHATAYVAASGDVRAWLKDRFNGAANAGTC